MADAVIETQICDRTLMLPGSTTTHENRIAQFSRLCSWLKLTSMYARMPQCSLPPFRDWRENGERMCSFSASVDALQTAIN